MTHRATGPPSQPSSRGVGRPSEATDLRSVLIDVTLRLLEQHGNPERVTVSAIVAEAHCTPPSLYHYWVTRDLLLREASARGWAQFRIMQGEAARGDDPIERITQRGRAYLDFALTRRALFGILFMTPGGGPGGAPGPALTELMSDVAEAVASHRLRGDDLLQVSLVLWSTVHGVAALAAAHPELGYAAAHALLEAAQTAVLRGLRPEPPDPTGHWPGDQ